MWQDIGARVLRLSRPSSTASGRLPTKAALEHALQMKIRHIKYFAELAVSPSDCQALQASPSDTALMFDPNNPTPPLCLPPTRARGETTHNAPGPSRPLAANMPAATYPAILAARQHEVPIPGPSHRLDGTGCVGRELMQRVECKPVQYSHLPCR